MRHSDFGLFIHGKQWANVPVGPLYEPSGDWLLAPLSVGGRGGACLQDTSSVPLLNCQVQVQVARQPAAAGPQVAYNARPSF
eukprot:scaffold1612_cov137-Isochrysis_galbana.AAC.5